MTAAVAGRGDLNQFEPGNKGIFADEFRIQASRGLCRNVWQSDSSPGWSVTYERRYMGVICMSFCWTVGGVW